MRYLIIGLGIYGTNLAQDLTDMGHEVIGADISSAKVEAIKEYISTAYILDSTDEASLNALPLNNVDLTIVAIGENFGASIKTVALLKHAGVKNIYARAIDKLHEAILEGLQVTRIVTPEQRAARDLTFEMELGTHVKSLRVDDEYFVADFIAPEYFSGLKYSELKPERMYGLKLICAARKGNKTNILGIRNEIFAVIDTDKAEAEVAPGDKITCYGTKKMFKSLFRLLTPLS